MAKKEQFVTDEQRKKLESLLPQHQRSPKGGPNAETTAMYSKA